MSSELHSTISERAYKWSFFGMGTSDMVLQSIIPLECLETVVILADKGS